LNQLPIEFVASEIDPVFVFFFLVPELPSNGVLWN
jgi:hypothetical protein